MSIILRALKKIQEQKEEQSPKTDAVAMEKGESASYAGAAPVAETGEESGEFEPAGAETGDDRGPGESHTAEGRHRFATGPKLLLGLMAVLGIFATGWFVSRLYSTADIRTTEAGSKVTVTARPQAIPPAPIETTGSEDNPPSSTALPPQIVASTIELRPGPDESIAKEDSPEEPPMNLAEKEAPPKEAGKPELKINAIAWRSSEPRAIVNMQRVYEGDSIEGATVLKIGRKIILFEYDGETFKVRF